jgi:hypothetical protein
MSLRKQMFLVIVTTSTLFSLCYATEQLSGNEITVQPDINKVAMEELNMTSLRFCND